MDKQTPISQMARGAEMSALRVAAQAVIARWATPLWKDVPATAVYIEALRAALAEPDAVPAPKGPK